MAAFVPLVLLTAAAALPAPAPSCPEVATRVDGVLPVLPGSFAEALSAAAVDCSLPLDSDSSITIFAPSSPTSDVSNYIAQGAASSADSSDIVTLGGATVHWTADDRLELDGTEWAVSESSSSDGFAVYLLAPVLEERDGDDIDTDIVDPVEPAVAKVLKGRGSSSGGSRGSSSSGGSRGSSGSSSNSGSTYKDSSGSSGGSTVGGAAGGGVVGAGVGSSGGGGTTDGNSRPYNNNNNNNNRNRTSSATTMRTVAAATWVLPIAAMAVGL